MTSINKITRKGKALFLAYDQGLEHGPDDFKGKNADPQFIINLAKQGKFTALIFQKGIVEKYHKEIKKNKIPLIIKMNGKTSLVQGEPLSRQLCSVQEAIKYGAQAVGYTIYLGSQHESMMMQEFETIEREAHAKNIPVILWAYPRGKSIEGKNKAKLMAYAARIGLELCADIVKTNLHGNKKDVEWAVKSAGKTKIVISGGEKMNDKKLLNVVREVMSAGCLGLAIGRNIWQHKHPLEITEKIRKIIWKK